MSSEIYEVPDLYKLDKLNDDEAVLSAVSLAKSMVARDFPMLGGILIQMKSVIDDVKAPAGVSYDKGQIILHINTEHWFGLIETNTDLSALLIHEVLHITQNHIARFNYLTENKNMNVAMDLAINQFDELVNTELVTKGVNMQSVSQFVELKSGGLVSNESAEYYLSRFVESPNNGNGNNGNSGSKDKGNNESQQAPDHSVWTDGQSEASEIMQTTAQVIENAMQATDNNHTNGRGLVAGELLELIKEKGKVFSIPTLSNGLKSEIKRLMKKPTKRTYFKYAPEWSKGVLRRGKKRVAKPEQTIDVFVDTSGSISEKELANALVSIDAYNKRLSVPTMLKQRYFDTQVYEQETKLDEVIGRGGTRMQAVFDYLKENDYPKNTNFIVITDGQGEKNINDYGYVGTWLLTAKPHTNIPKEHKQVRIEASA